MASQKNSICLRLMLHLFVSTSSAYFAGLNRMNWVDSKQYCESRSTTLASMHSEQDFLDMKQACIATGTGKDCWIGLDYQNDKYIYLDNTPLDYGFNTDGSPTTGQYPWGSGQPNDDPTDLDLDHCVQLEDSRDYLLYDDGCHNPEHPLCNDVVNNTSTTMVPIAADQDEPNDYLWIIVLSATILLCVCITIIIIRTVKRKRKNESTNNEGNMENECIGSDTIEFTAKQGDDKQVLKVEDASDAPPVPKSLDIASRDTSKEVRHVRGDSELMYVNNKNEIDTDDVIALTDEEEENENENERGNKDAAEGKADEEIRDWLAGFGLDEYTNNFIKNGFDSLKFVKAIKGMDNLKQIGVKLLGHRVLMMEEINKLDVNTKNDGDKNENDDVIVTTTTIAEGGSEEMYLNTTLQPNDDKQTITDGGKKTVKKSFDTNGFIGDI